MASIACQYYEYWVISILAASGKVGPEYPPQFHYVIENHISPRKWISTLRRTLSGLLNTDDESEISNVLQECYYEWYEMVCSKDELSDREEQAIKDGYYPLNLSENEHISATWRLFLKNQRKSAETSN